MTGNTVRRISFVVLLLLVLQVMSDTFSGAHAFGYFQDPTRLFWFGILPLLLVFAYGVSLLIAPQADLLRTILTLALCIGILVTVVGLQMIVRAERPVTTYVHDGAVQTEAASHFLRQGKNPYSADYRNTEFGRYIDIFSQGERPNPAWTHYVYLPGSFLLVAPFQWFFETYANWFDARLVYLLFWVGLLLLLARYAVAPWRDLGIMIVSLSPFILKFTVAGLNDITVVFFLYLGIIFFARQRYHASGWSIALALLMKQSAWLLVPFYFLAFWKVRGPGAWRRVYRPFFMPTGLVALVMLFFFVWSPGDFIADVWSYANGSAEYSYPASGVGLSKWLVTYGFIDQYAYFPFWIFSLGIGVPIFLWLLRRSRRDIAAAPDMLWSYGFSLLAFWFFARYFNDTHVAFLAMVFLLASLPLRSLPEAYPTEQRGKL